MNVGRVLEIAVLVAVVATSPALAYHRIGDVARIKGQEENVLHGMGLVVGLKGTGDGDNKVMLRALAHYMDMLGHRVGSSQSGQPMLDELRNVKNVALVFVTAVVPAGGAQQGDTLDCQISSALSAKSLEGGTLMLTELYGPVPGDKTVFGLAKGLVSIDDAGKPQTGRIPLGCQLEKSVKNQFVTKEGKLMLVMNKDHATFQTTAEVESQINSQRDFTPESGGQQVARAIDQVQIEVTIPPNYRDNPALFASLLLETSLAPPQVDTLVIINERKQAIIVGEEVEIGPVAVMHKNRLIQVGEQQVNEAVGINPIADSQKTKLAALVDALNRQKVPTSDVIDMIKMLKHKRALFGELIIE
jgi:flagellar P-ring protein precursor FlgI